MPLSCAGHIMTGSTLTVSSVWVRDDTCFGAARSVIIKMLIFSHAFFDFF